MSDKVQHALVAALTASLVSVAVTKQMLPPDDDTPPIAGPKGDKGDPGEKGDLGEPGPSSVRKIATPLFADRSYHAPANIVGTGSSLNMSAGNAYAYLTIAPSDRDTSGVLVNLPDVAGLAVELWSSSENGHIGNKLGEKIGPNTGTYYQIAAEIPAGARLYLIVRAPIGINYTTSSLATPDFAFNPVFPPTSCFQSSDGGVSWFPASMAGVQPRTLFIHGTLPY